MIISEVGLDMSRFPTPGHLASWARFAPGVKQSAGKNKGRGSTGKGNRYLARTLGEAAIGASRTNTFLGERYRRIARRRGKKKAIVAVGRSILTIVWHLLSDPDARYNDLGSDWFTRRINPDRKNAITSASSKPSGSKSPWRPPPDTPGTTNPNGNRRAGVRCRLPTYCPIFGLDHLMYVVPGRRDRGGRVGL
ncbi:transposase [Planotetraspora sp. GP83]|uniref:transposase n=1 Tax=Planotetraspora sp. GP83 TaxID=3156264 RepID=UPI0035171F86